MSSFVPTARDLRFYVEVHIDTTGKNCKKIILKNKKKFNKIKFFNFKKEIKHLFFFI